MQKPFENHSSKRDGSKYTLVWTNLNNYSVGVSEIGSVRVADSQLQNNTHSFILNVFTHR